ncbi:MAG TPA: hypothetical protein VF522_11335 [Ramlibacter sp.]|uniref:hypothetical protein n=1 Tax=Ramlibacter sp. TaxID=1917967 RepID=UPI002ED1C363
MKPAVLFAAILISIPALCQAQELPREVHAFISERTICEHFLGEIDGSNSPEGAERRRFVSDSIEKHCAGTDKRLAALRLRYRGNEAVLRALGAFEERIE